MQMKGRTLKVDDYRRNERKEEVSKNGKNDIKEKCGGKHGNENDGI